MRDFTLTLAKSDMPGCYSVSATNETTACPGGSFFLPADVDSRLVGPLCAHAQEAISEEFLNRIGMELGSWLFPEAVLRWIEDSWDRSTGPVRLRIVTECREIDALPWEVAFFGPGPPHLALHSDISILRVPREAPASVEMQEDPRVLIVVSDPGSAAFPKLGAMESEIAAVRNALIGAEIHELRYPTPASLRRAIEERAPHILHFVGHGDERPSGGVLVLHGQTEGMESVVYADEFGSWLSAAEVRLAVLSACYSGSAPSGIARVLSESGVAAVVAMQMPLRDAAATDFADAFYTRLAQTGTVEEAMSEGRRSLGEQGSDWAVPVLYLSVGQSRLFAFTCLTPISLPFLHNPMFVGRGPILKRMHEVLSGEEPSPVALLGLAGLGKTQVAVEYAHTHAKDYPAGVFWLNAQSTERLTEEFASLGRFFGIPEMESVSARAERVRDALHQAGAPSLLILDNVTAHTDRRLLRLGGKCRLLVTTRERFTVPQGFVLIALPLLDEDAAFALLTGFGVPDEPNEQAAAKQIVSLLGHLPLGLVLMAHYIERIGSSFSACHARVVGDRRSVLQKARKSFIAATEHDGRIFDTIEIASQSLGDAAREVLSVASCFAGRGISPQLLSRACVQDEESFEEALADLWSSSLVTREENGRLTVHELVRVYAHEMVTPLALGTVSGLLVDMLREANDTMDWRECRAETGHCVAAADLCRKRGAQSHFSDLLLELGTYTFEQGEHAVAKEYFQEGLEIAEGRLARAMFLKKLAETKQALGDSEGALDAAGQALVLAEATVDASSPVIADYCNTMGYVLKLSGRTEAALPYYIRSLDINEAAYGRQDRNVAMCLSNIGMALKNLDHLEEARAAVSEALEIDRELFGPDSVKVAIRLNNLGQILGHLGETDKALVCHREAMRIYAAAHGPEHLDVADSLYHMAMTEMRAGNREEAGRHWQEALPTYEHFYGPDHPTCLKVRERLQDIFSSGQ